MPCATCPPLTAFGACAAQVEYDSHLRAVSWHVRFADVAAAQAAEARFKDRLLGTRSVRTHPGPAALSGALTCMVYGTLWPLLLPLR